MDTVEAGKLFVDTNSWHYRYFCHIRKLLGMPQPNSKNSSLCPYFQTIVLGSLVFVLSLPLQLLGWVVLRGCRWGYRLAEQSGFVKLIDFIDSTFFGNLLDKSDDHLESSLIGTLVLWGITGLLVIGAIGTVASVFVVGGWYFLLLIPKIPFALYWMLMTIGWAVIQFFYGIAWLVVTIASAVWFAATWLFTNLLWLFTTKAIWAAVLYWVGTAMIVVGATIIVAYTIMQILNTDGAKRAINLIKMKFNGFHEAREKAKKRRVVAKRTSDQLILDLKQEQAKREQTFLYRTINFIDFAALNIIGFFVSKSVKVKGVAGKALSIMSVLGLGLWAIKQRACPIIEFVDLNSIKPEPVVEAKCAKGCDCYYHDEGNAATVAE